MDYECRPSHLIPAVICKKGTKGCIINHDKLSTEEGTDGTSGCCPSATEDGQLGTSVHSSPLPVSQNRFYNEPGGICDICGQYFDDIGDLLIHLDRAHDE